MYSAKTAGFRLDISLERNEDANLASIQLPVDLSSLDRLFKHMRRQDTLQTDGNILKTQYVSEMNSSSQEQMLSVWKYRLRLECSVRDSRCFSLALTQFINDSNNLLFNTSPVLYELKIKQISLGAFVAADSAESFRPRVGEELFNLADRPYGSKYDTALYFLWPEESNENLGQIHVEILPMNPEGTHVHCLTTCNVSQRYFHQEEYNALDKGTSCFFQESIDKSILLISSVLGR